MILLLGSSGDTNFDLVIDWLDRFQHPWLRLNADDPLLDRFSLSLSPPRLLLGDDEVDLASIGAVWCCKLVPLARATWARRTKGRLRDDVIEQLHEEHGAVLESLRCLLGDRYWLTHASQLFVNKLEMLEYARAAGFMVPETHLVNTREDLLRILATGEFISKSVYEPLFWGDDDGSYSMFTTVIDPGVARRLPDRFVPSLIQRHIRKAYELRVFYLDGTCHAMAIFSQSHPLTAVDFRQVDWARPNRNLPFELPAEVEAAIGRFMKFTGRNCGSIDLMRDPAGGYWFLEINPVGQFGMVAFPCNYPLFENIAAHLIHHDHRDGLREQT